jgi:hypothetical protein
VISLGEPFASGDRPNSPLRRQGGPKPLCPANINNAALSVKLRLTSPFRAPALYHVDSSADGCSAQHSRFEAIAVT